MNCEKVINIQQVALDFYTAITLALADGVSEYIKDGNKVLAIKADDMQAYFDEIAKHYGIEINKAKAEGDKHGTKRFDGQ